MGEKLSPQITPDNALIQIVEGEIVIDNQSFTLIEGESIFLPKDIIHSINAQQSFKMLRTFIISTV